MNRRFLLTTGAAAVIVAGAGWALTREPKAARAPWSDAAQGFGDPRLDALAFAILAPNPHNMQPWRVTLEGETDFVLHCDLRRLLPQTDPPNRQITIGFGCFLEMFRQAAAAMGYRAETTPFPDGEPYPVLDESPIARVRMVADDSIARDPLFDHALARRTNRNAFEDRAPVSATLYQLLDAAADGSALAASGGLRFGASAEPTLRDQLRALTVDAWHVEWSTPRTRLESVKVTRFGKNEVNEAPYGIAMTGAPMEALCAVGVLTRENMDTPGTTAYDQSVVFYDKACRTAAAHAWSITKTNTRADQLAAGAAWVRMQQAAGAAGLAFHPLSQALQEFPEMQEHYDRAHALLGAAEGETVQMLVRLGYADAPPPAPREPLASKIVGI